MDYKIKAANGTAWVYSKELLEKYPKLKGGYSPISPHPLFHFYHGNRKSLVMNMTDSKDQSFLLPKLFKQQKRFQEKLNESNLAQPKQFFCINLDRREDRWKEFLAKKPHEINVERFSAIDGKFLFSYDLTEIEKKIPLKGNGGTYGNGVVGCFLSHYRLWKKISSDDGLLDDDSVFIFEDDAHFVQDWRDRFYFTFSEIKDKEWDLVYVGGRFWPNFAPFPAALDKHFDKVTDSVYKFKDSQLNPNLHRTTHAYAIRKSGAIKGCKEVEKMLQEKPERFGPIDEFLNDRHTNPLIGFDFVPHLCWSPMDYRTDVQGL